MFKETHKKLKSGTFHPVNVYRNLAKDGNRTMRIPYR